MAELNQKLPSILPAGTQIVLRVDVSCIGGRDVRLTGAVASVVRSPVDAEHRYLIRFPDGAEAAVLRRQIAVRKQVQREGLAGPGCVLSSDQSREEDGNLTRDTAGGGCATSAMDEFELRPFVIYRCVIGSRAYGLEEAGSDVDRRGIYLPPAERHWSLFGVPPQIENDATQECYWEIEKFLTLALKANPNVLECLYSPLVEHATPLARRLLEMREAFLSRLIYQTYNGYVLSQFKKLEGDLRNRGEIKWKHAMHLLRLLLSGIVALREGHVPVAVGEHRDRLLAIRRGEMAWEEINGWRLALHKEFDAAFAGTALPERPDYGRVNGFLIVARREAMRESRNDAVQVTVGSVPITERDDRVLIEARVRLEAIPVLDQVVARQPYPLVFVTISGAHLYGFASVDSDFDLRGVHVLPAREVMGLDAGRETVEVDANESGLEIDLVSHDAAKFFGLMLKRNGYVLEQLYSPLVVRTSPEHEELKRLGRGCITRHHVHHYLGFYATQRKLFEKDQRLKPMLYTYRVLLTGIHLLRTGEVEANLEVLNGEFKLPYIGELLSAKREGREQDVWQGGDLAFHLAVFDRLEGELKRAGEESGLPDVPTVRGELSEMLVRMRVGL